MDPVEKIIMGYKPHKNENCGTIKKNKIFLRICKTRYFGPIEHTKTSKEKRVEKITFYRMY